MFEQLESHKWPSRRAGVVGTAVGAFAMGLATGKLIAGVRPFDWTLQILDMIFVLGCTAWFFLAAIRNSTDANSRH